MDKLQEISPSTSYLTEASVSSKTFTARVSGLFYKKETFEKKFYKRLDKLTHLSFEVDTNHLKYKFIKASLARNALQTSKEDDFEREQINFLKRFETIYTKKQKSLSKLLNMIKTKEDLNKALQIINNRYASTDDPIEQLGIAKIKKVLHKTFNRPHSNTPSSSIKKLVKLNKFVTTLPTILEEDPLRPTSILSTKL